MRKRPLAQLVQKEGESAQVWQAGSQRWHLPSTPTMWPGPQSAQLLLLAESDFPDPQATQFEAVDLQRRQFGEQDLQLPLEASKNCPSPHTETQWLEAFIAKPGAQAVQLTGALHVEQFEWHSWQMEPSSMKPAAGHAAHRFVAYCRACPGGQLAHHAPVCWQVAQFVEHRTKGLSLPPSADTKPVDEKLVELRQPEAPSTSK